MADKLSWLRKHGDVMRQALMLEPRGHAAMHGALFTEPTLADAHAGLLSMHAAGFSEVSGEAIMAAVRLGLAHKILTVDDETIRIDTPAGVISAMAIDAEHQREGAGRVSITGVAAYVHAPSMPIRFHGRKVLVDVAFGGELLAIVDGESVGIPVEADYAREMIRGASELQSAVDVGLRNADAGASQTAGVVFTSPARGAAHLRCATVLSGGILRRSPGVTSTAAIMAVLDAMGILDDGQPFISESIIGTQLHGRLVKRGRMGERDVMFPAIEATVVPTGRHEFTVADSELWFRIG
jgi:proline racemase